MLTQEDIISPTKSSGRAEHEQLQHDRKNAQRVTKLAIPKIRTSHLDKENKNCANEIASKKDQSKENSLIEQEEPKSSTTVNGISAQDLINKHVKKLARR